LDSIERSPADVHVYYLFFIGCAKVKVHWSGVYTSSCSSYKEWFNIRGKPV